MSQVCSHEVLGDSPRLGGVDLHVDHDAKDVDVDAQRLLVNKQRSRKHYLSCTLGHYLDLTDFLNMGFLVGRLFDKDGDRNGDLALQDRTGWSTSTLMGIAWVRSIWTVRIDPDRQGRDLDKLKINHDQVQVTSSYVMYAFFVSPTILGACVPQSAHWVVKDI